MQKKTFFLFKSKHLDGKNTFLFFTYKILLRRGVFVVQTLLFFIFLIIPKAVYSQIQKDDRKHTKVYLTNKAQLFSADSAFNSQVEIGNIVLVENQESGSTPKAISKTKNSEKKIKLLADSERQKTDLVNKEVSRFKKEKEKLESLASRLKSCPENSFLYSEKKGNKSAVISNFYSKKSPMFFAVVFPNYILYLMWKYQRKKFYLIFLKKAIILKLVMPDRQLMY